MTTNTTITPELLDQLLANYEKPEDLTGRRRAFQAAEEGADRTGAGRGADRASGLREGRSGRPRQRQQPQRHEREDGADRGRRDRDRGAARPRRQLRAADRSPRAQTRFDGFDDKIIEPLRARHDGARDPGPPGRALRHRGLARPDQPGHRRGSRRGAGMAEPAARPGLSGGVLRRAAGQDPRRGPGQEQGRLRRAGAQSGRREGRAGAVDRADRGRQVLAQGHERAEDPRRQRHPDRGGRWAQGLSRGDRPRCFRRPWCRPASCT